MAASLPALLRRPLLWLLLVLGIGLVVAAVALAGRQELAIGSHAEQIYRLTGFYDGEHNGAGDFRWAQPAAEMRLPQVGPGRITLHLTLFDAAPADRDLRLLLDGREVYHGSTRHGGAPWTLTVSAEAASGTPTLAILTAPWNPPGDRRTLGVALTRLAVDAPAAAARTMFAEVALFISVLALALAWAAGTTQPDAPLVAGIAVLAFLGSLLAYGDVWLTRAAPILLLPALLAAFAIRRSGPRSALGAGHRAVIFVALALAGLLLLFTLARFNTGDAEGMYQVTAGLAEDAMPWQHKNHEWIKFGVGQPLATLPLYWLGRAWAGVTSANVDQLTRFCVALFNAAVIPATALVLFLGARRRFGPGVALAVSGSFLLATPAIAYSRLAFAEPSSGLLILVAFLLVFSNSLTGGRDRWLRVFAAGVCLGLAVLVKPANAIYLPVPALLLAWRLAKRPVSVRRLVSGMGVFGLGVLPGLLLTLGYNALRYGSPFVFGYEGEGFTTPLPVGLYGLLFSPGKGLIWYAPPVLLTPFALVACLRRGVLRAEAAAISAQAVIVLVFHALWSSWEGNIAWGPRLILPLVPLLLLPLGALADEVWARRAWWALGVAGLLTAIPGALVDQFYYFDINGVYGAGTAAEANMLFTPSWSPIIAEWRFLLTGTREAILRPTLESMGLNPAWDTALPVGFGVTALAWLVAASWSRLAKRASPVA
ncbi:MAG: ArnT family glycosyltransferase [Chloroflexia bacterium]